MPALLSCTGLRHRYLKQNNIQFKFFVKGKNNHILITLAENGRNNDVPID